MSQLGLLLRDAALTKSREGRTEAIQAVRDYLVQVKWIEGGPYPTLTADDVAQALEILDLHHGDTRWSANILLGWDKVECTDRVVRSRRKVNHGRRIAVWRWV